jgi:mitogen-activated protein kinase kinase kinase 11
LKVAVKVASITEAGLDGWRTEVQALQKLHHPNIIRLLGSVCHPNPLTFCMVLEYCESGDLATALLKPTPRNFFFHVAESVARGMSYLHNRGIIHRDIKAANVLLDGKVSSGEFHVKVTDFGVATDLSLSSDRTAETGTYRWMAPEVIRHESYSQTADVYSFSVVLWQLITREEPFTGETSIAAAAAVALEGRRPPFPPETPVSVEQLIKTCWSDDPDKRIPFEKIVTELHELRETKLTDEEKQWLEAPVGHRVYKKRIVDRASKSFGADLLPPQSPNEQKEGLHAASQSQPRLSPVQPNKKRPGFRKLFNRKSVHF